MSTANEIKKSTKATTTLAIGIINRGKYTLLIRFEFAMRLLDASVMPLANNAQGSIPAKTISGYGASPADGNFAIRPKMTVNTTMVRSGRISADVAPIIVCLYRTATARH